MNKGLPVALCLLAIPGGCDAATTSAQEQLSIEVAFPGIRFTRPVDLQHAGDGSERIFVVEQAGIIKVLAPDRASAAVFLDIRDRVRDRNNEEGLLGLAFHPQFADNKEFFVNYTASNPRRSVVARYTVLGSGLADAGSEEVILSTPQPAGNHNGGQIVFGPDGYLYIGLGDGGGAGDSYQNGQNRSTLLGTILRVDVNTATGYGIPPDNPFAGNTAGLRGEIFAYGLRNPWRFSFDAETGLLYAADVGQNAYEEIDLIKSGANYGWNVMEGEHCYRPATGCNRSGLALPIHEYPHNGQAKSVTGGYVYRGASVPELAGMYVYADYVDGRIWGLDVDSDAGYRNTELLDTSLSISSFGVDEANELYLCAFDGQIYRFSPTNTSTEEQPANSFRLGTAYPNPFQDATSLTYVLRESAHVDMAVYSVQGRRLRSLVRGKLPAGTHTTRWNGRDGVNAQLAAGVYVIRLMLDGQPIESRRVVLAR